MKIRFVSNPITPHGSFSRGEIIDSSQYPEAFLMHLVHDCGAAEFIDAPVAAIQNKLDPALKRELKKKEDSQSQPQARASKKKASKKRPNTPK